MPELRNANLLIAPYPRIELFKKSPLYSLSKLWNALDETKYQQNETTFKIAIKINCLMKKISSMNNSLYRLELESGNKLQKIFTICYNARILSYTTGVVPSPLPLPPFPGPRRALGVQTSRPLRKRYFIYC